MTKPSLVLDSQPRSEIGQALRRCGAAFLGIGLFSGVVNLLALTGSIYMLQVYDRVIPSRSVPTLVGLTLLMVALYVAHGLLDLVRSRIMSRIGLRLDRALRARVFETVLLLPLRLRPGGDGLQPVRDLDQIRGFLSGTGPVALFDMPWMAVYLALVYLLHPWLGMLAAAGAMVLVLLTLLTEALARAPAKAAALGAAARQLFGEANRRNAEAIRAMGMGRRMEESWEALSEKYLGQQLGSSDIATGLGALSRFLRMVLQSGILGLGAFLVIQGEATAGVIIAASIATARALAPVEIAIGNWNGFVNARQSHARLARVLAAVAPEREVMSLPRPEKNVAVQSLTVAAPGQPRPILHNVAFTLDAGAGLGVIGPSASGKSTLARAIVGAWLPQRGSVRLDGATLDQWQPDTLGRDIGYLPQDLQLFDGTIAENIARFDGQASSTAIIAAARNAGVHEMILQLPEGYETQIGEGGASLSAGQRQRIALARALYGDPFLVVLDEPNSNLDAEGDTALTQAIRSVRARGGIAIVIAHRPSALAAVDQLLVMGSGQVQAFGSKEQILKQVGVAGAATGVARRHSGLKLIADAAQTGA